MIKYNLGCGNYPKKGYINFDKFSEGEDINYLDLEDLPLQLPDTSADEVLMLDVLEHLFLNPYDFMVDEIHRILKPGGVVKISLPFFGAGLTHVRICHTKNYFKPICDGGWRKKKGILVVGGQSRELFDRINAKTVFNRVSASFPFIMLKNYYWLRKK